MWRSALPRTGMAGQAAPPGWSSTRSLARRAGSCSAHPPPPSRAPAPKPGGTRSAVWRYRGGCVRADSEPGWSPVATVSRAAGSPDTAPLRPGSRPAAPSGYTPARSAPFYGRVRIVNLDLAVLAPPSCQSRVAPRSVALPAQVGLVQHTPDGVRADLGEPILGAPQRLLERRQRPGRGLVPLPIRRPLDFGQDPLPFGGAVRHSQATPMAWLDRRQPLLIEPPDHLRDGIARTATDPPCRLGIRAPIGNRQQRSRPRDARYWRARRTTQLLQAHSFAVRQGAQRVLPSSTHRSPP